MTTSRLQVVSSVVASVFLLGEVGCGGDCIDGDSDGFGVNCERGPDCDENNPQRTDNCAVVPAPDCQTYPVQPGCPCVSGAVSECYTADEETLGVAACVAGTAYCRGGYWGPCNGAVLPQRETCNAVDDDCDGAVDEQVISPCGGCNAACEGVIWGSEDVPFTKGENTEVLAGHGLTLSRSPPTFNFLWVANTGEDTVSKIDINTMQEVARYAAGGSEPTRVAVDYLGDAWIANRSFSGQGSVTKIAGEPARCLDRGEPGVQTSTGPEDVLVEDDCVLFTAGVPLGELDAVPRALAVDANFSEAPGGHVWVGLHQSGEVVEVHGSTGDVLRRLPILDFQPYAAHADAWGRVWFASQNGFLAQVDRHPERLSARLIEVPLACYQVYGLTGNRSGELFMSNFSCNSAAAFDALRGTWRAVPTAASGRGVAVDGQRVWVAHTGGFIGSVAVRTFAFEQATSLSNHTVVLSNHTVAPVESVGMAIDSNGRGWVISSQGGDAGRGVATAVDLEQRKVLAQVEVGERPHVQGDLTGSQLRGAFVSPGEVTQVFSGCGSGSTQWEALHIDAMLHQGSVTVQGRQASSRPGLELVDFEDLDVFREGDGPVELAYPEDGFLELKLILHLESGDGAPLVRTVGVEWRCLGDGLEVS